MACFRACVGCLGHPEPKLRDKRQGGWLPRYRGSAKPSVSPSPHQRVLRPGPGGPPEHRRMPSCSADPVCPLLVRGAQRGGLRGPTMSKTKDPLCFPSCQEARLSGYAPSAFPDGHGAPGKVFFQDHLSAGEGAGSPRCQQRPGPDFSSRAPKRQLPGGVAPGRAVRLPSWDLGQRPPLSEPQFPRLEDRATVRPTSSVGSGEDSRRSCVTRGLATARRNPGGGREGRSAVASENSPAVSQT